ncbi:major facilitator superfamily domain-containing protein [Lasiosphaeria miniovina]|uniref:Major facilitator superfamily domain-containing protein n=1 Tax=Lasiosphaeria miniovina TaxID=1954250 RepID=A0AA40BJB8_9PEZI|nr:major facilitator superfamily domain-containing protein [Lasiosphaeria miniovina]KAK0735279.1 major facilitator superfamily domain-containing protein [Lasiosphaeria miniovina]
MESHSASKEQTADDRRSSPSRSITSSQSATITLSDVTSLAIPPSHSPSSSSSSLSDEKGYACQKPPTVEWARGEGFWRCFIAVCVPILLSAFEGSVVSTALPTISQALNLGPDSSWVATAFLLASIVCQPLYGQLADIWGRRHLMMVAVVLFGIGSAISGAAISGAMLIFGRITQGMGSGGIDLFAELILCDIIPLKRRGHYVAIKAAVYALGTTVGPVLGGVFAETSWRWCFGVNIPVCVAALVMIWCWLQVNTGQRWDEVPILERIKCIDFTGIGLLTASVVLVLFALTSGGAAYSWSSPAVAGTVALGSSGIVVFAAWERCRWCAHPIMAPHVFSNRTTIAGFVVTVLHGFVTYGFQFYLPPFFQAVMGSSPTESGVLILPCTLTIVVIAAAGGPLLARFGKYRLMHQAGFVLMAVGFLLCTVFDQADSVALWIMFSFLVGIGSGIIVSTTLPTVLVELTDRENAAATGSWAFLRGLGSLLGVAVPNAAFNAQFSTTLQTIHSAAAQDQLRGGRAYEHATAAFVSRFGPQVKTEIISAFSSSLRVTWIVFLVLSCVGIAITFLERQVKLRKGLDSDYDLKAKGDSEF